MKFTKLAMLLLAVAIAASPALAKQPKGKVQKHAAPVNVIFDTDMGNDIDDALALDMLYKYADEGKIKLLAIMTNKRGAASAQFIDLMNTWYGHNVPIGIVRDGCDCDSDGVEYLNNTINYLGPDGKPAFKRSIANVDRLPYAEDLYRQILAKQPNASVVVISTGFSTNIAHLLQSKPDKASRLNGRQLVARKVKHFSIMGGSSAQQPVPEYNIMRDTVAAQYFFKHSPVLIVSSPFEVGIKVPLAIDGLLDWTSPHPLKVAYGFHHKQGGSTPTWDLTSVLWGVEPGAGYFTHGCKGFVTVDGKGVTHFARNRKGNFEFLNVPTDEQAQRIVERMRQLIGGKPRNRQ